jgi:hypothetical protein
VYFTIANPGSFFQSHPFTHQHLSFGMELSPRCAKPCFVHIDIPDNIALRSRSDNSDFYSLSLGLDSENYRRNTLLFNKAGMDGQEIVLNHRFGVNNFGELIAPIFPIFRVGTGVLIGAFATHALIALDADQQPISYPNVAPLALALSLAPWFFEPFRRTRFFRSSSTVGRVPLEAWALVAAASIHTAYVFATGYILWNKDTTELAYSVVFWELVGGGVLVAAALLSGLLILLGTFAAYSCDSCDRRFVSRRVPVRYPSDRYARHRLIEQRWSQRSRFTRWLSSRVPIEEDFDAAREETLQRIVLCLPCHQKRLGAKEETENR